MAHTNKTYINNGGSLGVNSLFPNGGAPAPATGITYAGSPTHGSIIKIIAGADVNFGDVGCDFIWGSKTENMTAGTDLTLVEGVTHKSGYITYTQPPAYTTGTKFKIKTIAGLPYNVGYAVGDYQLVNRQSTSVFPKIRTIVARPSAKVFRSAYMIWPAANQAIQMTTHDGGEQVKLFGDQYQDGFSTGGGIKVDIYTGLYSPTATGDQMEAKGAISKSNQAGFNENDSWLFPTTGAGSLGHQVTTSSTTQKSNVQIYQSFFISRNPTNTAHSRVIDTDLGEVCNFTDTHPTPAVCQFTSVDRFDFPLNCQGMNEPQGKNFFVSHVYQAYGEGAACRVELANTPTPIAMDTNLTKVSVNFPVSWSNKLIQVELVEGMFWGQSLVGKYLHVYGINNNFIASCAL